MVFQLFLIKIASVLLIILILGSVGYGCTILAHNKKIEKVLSCVLFSIVWSILSVFILITIVNLAYIFNYMF